ncbi:glycoside hydrolase [Verrucomicrobia bacterium]|nr:glycoside hydrolase [Verrucomicrobiota bacterium]
MKLFAILGIIGLLTATSSNATAFPTTAVFEAGKEGYKIYRIPAVIIAANNDLLAFCEAREGGDASKTDLVMKRSLDRGETWEKLQVVQAADDYDNLFSKRQPDITVGNPAPVVDLLDPEHPGRIWLPLTVENDRIFVVHSDDHGKTWSKRREITKTVKKDAWGWYATGPVHSIQLTHGKYKGRLVIPCDHRIGTDGADKGQLGAHAVLSDDHGKTWRLGAIDASYENGLESNETTVIELNTGQLLFNTRDQNGKAKGTRGISWSKDGGETFDSGMKKWENFKPILGVMDPPVVQCSLLRANKNLILFSGPDDNGPTGKGRSDMRIRWSRDEGQTWKDGPLIHVGPAAYSDMVVPEKGIVGILHEAGDAGQKSAYQRIVFTRVPVGAIK